MRPNILKKKLILKSFFISCSLLICTSACSYPSNEIPPGTIYSQNNTTEIFTQNADGFSMAFRALGFNNSRGFLGCDSIFSQPSSNFPGPIYWSPINNNCESYEMRPSFNLFQQLINDFIDFPHYAMPPSDHVQFDIYNKWKNPTYSGLFIVGPYISVDRGGELIAIFDFKAEVYTLTDIPVKSYTSFQNTSVHPSDVMLTAELTSDGIILAKKDLNFSEFTCVDGLYFEDYAKIFYRTSSKKSYVRFGLLKCYYKEESLALVAKVNGNTDNIEARISVKNSPVLLSVYSTKIIHNY